MHNNDGDNVIWGIGVFLVAAVVIGMIVSSANHRAEIRECVAQSGHKVVAKAQRDDQDRTWYILNDGDQDFQAHVQAGPCRVNIVYGRFSEYEIAAREQIERESFDY